jgi:phage gp16-like protein
MIDQNKYERTESPKLVEGSRAKDVRRSAIAAIHVARQQLDMDDEAYRAMLSRVSAQHGREVRSAADLDDRQREAVLDELRRLGAVRPSKERHPGKPHNFASESMPALITKIEGQLSAMKLPWSYADAIGMQQTGVAKVAWIREPAQLRSIIAALHVEQEKRSLNAAIDVHLTRLGWEPAHVVEMLKPLRPNWRRHRPSLRLVLDHLAST